MYFMYSFLLQDVISDFWVFRPRIDCILKGIVTRRSASRITCLVHGIFSINCHRPLNLDSTVSWFGSQVPLGMTVRFKVTSTDLSQNVPFILGELIEKKCTPEPDPFKSRVNITLYLNRLLLLITLGCRQIQLFLLLIGSEHEEFFFFICFI